ncbi:peptidase S41 [Pseudoxanthomonas broegbernensis]|uniref:Peptidase S41 n=1 Tax=Pseudoxanthomonas broegbernensis TaxID=83619 RepID=A0A7V8GJY4_9GAMM|nr:S41 family peptidase [Pseudoxanthomonas broegbernensis]KAF1684694.1 peptidase S41 [Pseudoxanthomonas broegbernensis]MBB6066455.1 carboxyl-terminal processing protease [Pseudoxanthomonas broegbernensis]
MRRLFHVLLLSALLLGKAPPLAAQTGPVEPPAAAEDAAGSLPADGAAEDGESAPAPPDRDADAPVPASDDPDAADTRASKVPLAEIRRYVAVYNAIKEAYVDPVDDRALMQSAIVGLLLDLDPHSAYLDRAQSESFEEQTSGAYDGIGVELLQQPDNTLKVIAPIDGTPAARAGVLAGDTIVAIDGRPIAQVEGMEPLRGASGSRVTITVVRAGQDKPFDLSMVRETIKVTSVRSRMLEPGYAYVRISTFQADTGTDFRHQVDQLQERAGGRLQGLVLDLRSNPGGLLTAAVQVADELLERGGIVSTRGRIAVSDSRFDATPGDRLHGAPVVVLMDAGSASAAEVLAGALRDNGRARLVGSRSFGKGSVQTVLPLDNGDSVKLTTARYYTPSGRSIQASGIVPDVELQPDPALMRPDAPASLGELSEAILPGHLQGEDEDGEGHRAGSALPGEQPIAAALAELKKLAAAAATAPATTH